MIADFDTIQNYQERLVFAEVTELANRRPELASHKDLLADVACMALNRLAPRYIRHQVDFHFYRDNVERARSEQEVVQAVKESLALILARDATQPRS